MKGKRFIYMLLLVGLLLIVVDALIGLGAYKLMSTAKSGDSARAYHINKRTTADVLVFGSSRAIHHYDPDVLKAQWGLPVYNAGKDGCGILLNYMQFTNILQRHTPKIVIMDIFGPYDFIKENDYSRYLGWGRPFYGKGNAALDSVINDADSKERYKNLSNAYRYNYRIIQILADNLISHAQDNCGYRPEQGVMKPENAKDFCWGEVEFDPLKLEYIRRFAERCREKGIRLYAVASPYYVESGNEEIPQRVRDILRTYGAEVIDMSRDPEFLGKEQLFYDTNHLNSAGARLFSRRIAQQIDSLQKTESQRDKK